MSDKKDKARVNKDVRPHVFVRNYDYAGPKDGDEVSPGTGFYGVMGDQKSVTEFLEKARKRENRKNAFAEMIIKYKL